ncbi:MULTISPECIES: phosphate butyryltransferase [Exiguobacterium]|uniref:Phosphate butyryltransferase n=1 Tax=Exiguobacterium antarcticum TaxID=132920 RepID=A0ABT6R302_9BACL|nr:MULTISPECIES: phosphate butyryltransferase [Exiguobacterium]AFS70029.1 Phosphate butyryltransferase [Exiguobacterium antarcticum B7]MCT4779501.1 phosphate butyryltransferase [Exiguobacterium soli]MDI3235322.1 phosphate butyryltransferase [Exiguobacterium antarcticum]
MRFDQMVRQAARLEDSVVAIASADDEEVMDAVSLAIENELARFHLFGDATRIQKMIHDRKLSESQFVITHTATAQEAAERAAYAVRKGDADVLMKGLVPTATFMKAVLNKETGLRSGNVLSHVALFEVPGRETAIGLTDAAIHIAPTLEDKVHIIENGVTALRAIGYTLPKVAVLAAVEVVNPTMQATIDAALLTQMNRRGQIKDCLVDGPLALDNAVNLEAAKQKGLTGDVAGAADLLVVPQIEVGNVIYKSLMYFAQASVAAILVGAKAPVVLTSRADTAEAKLYSLAFALLNAQPTKKLTQTI